MRINIFTVALIIFYFLGSEHASKSQNVAPPPSKTEELKKELAEKTVRNNVVIDSATAGLGKLDMLKEKTDKTATIAGQTTLILQDNNKRLDSLLSAKPEVKPSEPTRYNPTHPVPAKPEIKPYKHKKKR